MKHSNGKGALSMIELSVLETLKKIGFKSAFQMAENLAGRYDTLTVMRTMHSLLKRELLVRYSVDGERYYMLNEKQSSKINVLLNHYSVQTPMLVQAKSQ
jgi:hypothetical protein